MLIFPHLKNSGEGSKEFLCFDLAFSHLRLGATIRADLIAQMTNSATVRMKRNNSLQRSSPKCNKLWCCYRPKSSSSNIIPPISQLILLVEASSNRNFLLTVVALLSGIKAVVPAAMAIAAAATKIASAPWPSTVGHTAAVTILVLRAIRDYLGSIEMQPRSLIKWVVTPIILHLTVVV
jgi:hypothetical protein